MSTRTIASPGVQINELDQSLIARPIGATSVFITGFTQQGPTETPVNITSISEFEEVYGLPSNDAERYLYHSAKQILQTSPANLLVSRMPYGSGNGVGFENTYSALLYSVSSNAISYRDATELIIQQPKSLLLTDDEYDKLLQNDITWSDKYDSHISGLGELGNAGFIVLNSQKTTINNYFEGYYVSIADNLAFNPSTNFESISSVKAINSFGDLKATQTYTTVPSSRLNFLLTQDYKTFGGESVSKAIETASYSTGFEKDDYKDSVVLTVFKLGATQYGKDALTLDYSIVEGYNGSLYSGRTEQSETGGPPVSRFLDTVINNNSKYIKVITNPYISDWGKWTSSDGFPTKRVKIADAVKSMFSIGSYTGDADVDKVNLGNIPAKLSRILYRFENDENIDIDITAECGLGTIWASSKAKLNTLSSFPTLSGKYVYDEEYNLSLSGMDGTDGNIPTGAAYSAYNEIAGPFVALADKTRKDHVFIADPIRNIFINGQNTKTSSRKEYVFSDKIYWTLKNQFAAIQSSYVSVYANWLKINDTTSNRQIWAPSSGFAAAIYASTSQQSFPWIAPAGFNRGTLVNVYDVAINPTQKQRDLLYKINMNPIAFFNNDGFVIYGQKTMFKKPSAFDRVNVRRLFLTLEKETKALLKYFVFEPNTFATRNRLKGALLPIFEQAKLNDGLYDYQLICDERNNTPDVIDNNELKISIYIKPVRAAEFILADFVATRTGIDFSELNG